MKAKDMFALALEQYSTGQPVSVVTSYKKAKKILKQFISLPDTKIRSIELSPPDWDGYDEAWLIDICEDKEIYCQKAINIEGDGMPFCGDGYYIIDKGAIGEFDPESFVFAGSTIKIVGGELSE